MGGCRLVVPMTGSFRPSLTGPIHGTSTPDKPAYAVAAPNDSRVIVLGTAGFACGEVVPGTTLAAVVADALAVPADAPPESCPPSCATAYGPAVPTTTRAVQTVTVRRSRMRRAAGEWGRAGPTGTP